MTNANNSVSLSLDHVKAEYAFVPGLNGLRALSISIVLFGHFMLKPSQHGVAALGVFIFFAISGFLITRLLFAEWNKNGSIGFRGFFFRRYLRLYPVLIVFLVLFISINLITHQETKAVDVFSVLLYFTNYLHNYYKLYGGEFSLPIGPLWSLAVEEHFYLVMPFAFAALKGRPRGVAGFAIASIVIALAIRLLYATIWPHLIGTEFVYRPSETRFDSIAVGVLLAAICELPDARRLMGLMASKWAFALALTLLLGSFAYKGEVFGDTLRYTLRNFGACF